MQHYFSEIFFLVAKKNIVGSHLKLDRKRRNNSLLINLSEPKKNSGHQFFIYRKMILSSLQANGKSCL